MRIALFFNTYNKSTEWQEIICCISLSGMVPKSTHQSKNDSKGLIKSK